MNSTDNIIVISSPQNVLTSVYLEPVGVSLNKRKTRAVNRTAKTNPQKIALVEFSHRYFRSVIILYLICAAECSVIILLVVMEVIAMIARTNAILCDYCTIVQLIFLWAIVFMRNIVTAG